jgi:DNA repair protein RAD50
LARSFCRSGPQARLRKEIADAERKVEAAETLDAQLETLHADKEDKAARVEKTRTEIGGARYDERVMELNAKHRDLESRREVFNEEIRSLNLRADQRAKYDLHQKAVDTKDREIKNL